MRYDSAKDLVLSLGTTDQFRGSITLDGSNPDHAEGEAHLRWFIVDNALQGQGHGKQLLGEVVTFLELVTTMRRPRLAPPRSHSRRSHRIDGETC